MKVLFAPDKFKGSLSAREVCRAMERGVRQVLPTAECHAVPMADGGEGTLDVLGAWEEMEMIRVKVSGPLFRPVQARYALRHDTAFVEMAEASGLPLLQKEERNPLYTTTLGTGELILDALHRGVRRVYLFVGGSATNDGGMGMAAALGYRFLDRQGRPLKPVGESLAEVMDIRDEGLLFDPAKMEVVVVCDVQNPLFGPEGAAYVYAPQKGAGEAEVEALDQGLRHFAAALEHYRGAEVATIPGAGAAGGIAAGAIALLGAAIQPGIQTLMELVDLESAARQADLIFSGEGKMDRQTLSGKVIFGVSQLARKHQKPLGVICGVSALSPEQIRSMGIWQTRTLADETTSVDKAITHAAALVSEKSRELMEAFLASSA